MTQQEKTLRIAGLMTILRDDLEDMNFDQEMKKVTNQWLKIANRKMKSISSGGVQANEELIKIVRHFDSVLRLEDLQV